MFRLLIVSAVAACAVAGCTSDRAPLSAPLVPIDSVVNDPLPLPVPLTPLDSVVHPPI